jgi:hypothetical protein
VWRLELGEELLPLVLPAHAPHTRGACDGGRLSAHDTTSLYIYLYSYLPMYLSMCV